MSDVIKVWVKDINDQWISSEVSGISVMSEPFEIRDTSDFCKINDLFDLTHLNEPNIIECLRSRLAAKLIYTLSGKILIAVNPYEVFTELYSHEVMNDYPSLDCESDETRNDHIYSIGFKAVWNLFRYGKDQNILICGESGSGKTESAKHLLELITRKCDKGSYECSKKLMCGNPLLESFGNARTIRNMNSSRFGKYIELEMGMMGLDAQLHGAKIYTYLLESVRVVSQSTGECNYHIFYQILSYLTDSTSLSIQHDKVRALCGVSKLDASCILESSFIRDYAILWSNHVKFATSFSATNEQFLEFASLEEVQSAYRLILGILGLGSIVVKQVDGDAVVDSDIGLSFVGEMLGVDVGYVRTVLVSKIIRTNSEECVKPLTLNQCIENRNALVKTLYLELFESLVSQISEKVRGTDVVGARLGILDIFGFEVLEVNSFEQLCINYANEAIQNFFFQQVVVNEQALFRKEEIGWSDVKFESNAKCVEIFTNNLGIFPLLDEESRIPGGSDDRYGEKVKKQYVSNKYIEELPMKKRSRGNGFIINHFAGPVDYLVENFVAKNKSDLYESTREFINSCSVAILGSRKITGSSKVTTGRRFVNELNSLILEMEKSTIYFIRCISSNYQGLARKFDQACVQQQLKASGVVSALTVCKSGYPIRLLGEDAWQEFYPLAKRSSYDSTCESSNDNQNVKRNAIMDDLRMVVNQYLPDDQFAIGLTKLFLKDSGYKHLVEEKTKRMESLALRLQSFWRRKRIVMHVRRLKAAALIVQRMVRRRLARDLLRRRRRSILLIQRSWKAYGSRKKFCVLKMSVVTIQRFSRRYIAVKAVRRRKELLLKLQAHVRRFLQRHSLHVRNMSIRTLQAWARRSIAIRMIYWYLQYGTPECRTPGDCTSDGGCNNIRDDRSSSGRVYDTAMRSAITGGKNKFKVYDGMSDHIGFHQPSNYGHFNSSSITVDNRAHNELCQTTGTEFSAPVSRRKGSIAYASDSLKAFSKEFAIQLVHCYDEVARLLEVPCDTSSTSFITQTGFYPMLFLRTDMNKTKNRATIYYVSECNTGQDEFLRKVRRVSKYSGNYLLLVDSASVETRRNELFLGLQNDKNYKGIESIKDAEAIRRFILLHRDVVDKEYERRDRSSHWSYSMGKNFINSFFSSVKSTVLEIGNSWTAPNALTILNGSSSPRERQITTVRAGDFLNGLILCHDDVSCQMDDDIVCYSYSCGVRDPENFIYGGCVMPNVVASIQRNGSFTIRKLKYEYGEKHRWTGNMGSEKDLIEITCCTTFYPNCGYSTPAEFDPEASGSATPGFEEEREVDDLSDVRADTEYIYIDACSVDARMPYTTELINTLDALLMSRSTSGDSWTLVAATTCGSVIGLAYNGCNFSKHSHKISSYPIISLTNVTIGGYCYIIALAKNNVAHLLDERLQLKDEVSFSRSVTALTVNQETFVVYATHEGLNGTTTVTAVEIIPSTPSFGTPQAFPVYLSQRATTLHVLGSGENGVLFALDGCTMSIYRCSFTDTNAIHELIGVRSLTISLPSNVHTFKVEVGCGIVFIDEDRRSLCFNVIPFSGMPQSRKISVEGKIHHFAYSTDLNEIYISSITDDPHKKAQNMIIRRQPGNTGVV